ncbi:MAG: hypothetical protein SGARI_007778 [Bacillariaceae sp.]
MPRQSDITRYDPGFKEAIKREFGSTASLCKAAGLIQFREWNYLEGQHDLMISLQDFADAEFGGDYTIVPSHVHLRQQGSNRLQRLLRDFGGTTFVAGRLGMRTETKKGPGIRLSWGPFDLEHGIALMDFVRQDQIQKIRPLREPANFMPTRAQFLEIGSHGTYLHEKTMEYGGYESVARRLGLEWKGDQANTAR